MCSWWWVDEPPEICRASVKTNRFKKSCILLAVICNYITMHEYMNIRFTLYIFLLANANSQHRLH
jgi:hypothetical protein